MKMYVRVLFNSEGASPLALLKVMSDLGFEPVVGEYDFYYELEERPNVFKDTLKTLHERLRGLKVLYSITTKKD